MTPERRFAFHGRGGAVFGIYAVTILLSILTLGIYYPWGKVRLKRYFYSQTEFEGDRFSYHGTGRELLVGWLKVLLALGVLYGGIMAAAFALPDDDPLQILVSILLGLAGWALVPVALVGSQRYRLSRSSWRGIRFSFRGTIREFFPIFARGSLLTALTLGLYTPFFQNDLRRYQVGHSFFGTTALSYDGEGRKLFPKFLAAIVLTPLTLGLYWFWYQAARDRFFWSHTCVAGARLRYDVKGGDLLLIALGSALALGFTLGLAYPWVRAAAMRFKLEHLVVAGDLDLDAVVQDARDASSAGEGLADFVAESLFDIELGL
ncbi:MAG: DUF898 domain-containing protein [Candidatus Sericytochromatia bacterium]|nr:DUF898 domain-containing protein [Candidatus Tanganyikabacteria bacterium]